MMGCRGALLACALTLLGSGHLHTVGAAHSASHHEILVQHAWHTFEERGDWSDWVETWKSVDHDGDGTIPVNHGEIIQLFKRHYNVLHERLDHDKHPEGAIHGGLAKANDATFAREAEAFLHVREKKHGSRHKRDPLTWDEFKEEMSAFMAEQKTKRGPMLERQYNPLLTVHKEL